MAAATLLRAGGRRLDLGDAPPPGDPAWGRMLPEWMKAIRYGLAVHCHRGLVCWANRAALDTLGVPLREVIGTSPLRFVHPADRPRFHREHERRVYGEAQPYPLRFVRPDGTEVDRLVIPEVLQDGEGRLLGALVLLVPTDTVADALQARIRDELEVTTDAVRRLLREVESLGVLDRERQLDKLRERSPEVAALSEREWTILRELARGHRVSTIARELDLSPHTVRNHLKAIFRKIGVQSQAELAEWVTSQL